MKNIMLGAFFVISGVLFHIYEVDKVRKIERIKGERQAESRCDLEKDSVASLYYRSGHNQGIEETNRVNRLKNQIREIKIIDSMNMVIKKDLEIKYRKEADAKIRRAIKKHDRNQSIKFRKMKNEYRDSVNQFFLEINTQQVKPKRLVNRTEEDKEEILISSKDAGNQDAEFLIQWDLVDKALHLTFSDLIKYLILLCFSISVLIYIFKPKMMFYNSKYV